MKELSIKEKAKRYDEVLSIAKEWYNNPNSSSIGKSYLYAVFSELKESEDERIRKSLINYVHCYGDAGDFTKKEFIAWIEKQGEKPTDEDIKEVLHTEYEKGRADVIAEMQKLAWSEEDKAMVEDIIEAIDTQYAVTDYNEMVNWLKSLKDRYTWKPSKEQMEFLLKYAEQNNYDGSILTSLYQDLKKLKG